MIHKSDTAYKSIGEVAEILNLVNKKKGTLNTHTIRFWEKEFNDLKPITRKGRRRYYQKHDIQLIKQIQSLLYQEGMTITGAKKNLQPSNDEKEDDLILKSAVNDLRVLLDKIK